MNGLSPLKIKLGTIRDMVGHQQKVVTDDGEVMLLTPGYDYAVGGRVGDRVRLEYRATDQLALWYGKVITPEEEQFYRGQLGQPPAPRSDIPQEGQ